MCKALISTTAILLLISQYSWAQQQNGRLHTITVHVNDTLAFKKYYSFKYRNQAGCSCLVVDASNISQKQIEQLKNDKNVRLMRVHEKPHIEAAIDFSNFAFNRISTAHQVFNALAGTGINLSVKEESIDPKDVDLIARTFSTPLSPTTISQHATTMAKLIGGAGNSFYKAKGVAPGSRLTSSDFTNLFPDAISTLQTNNIFVQNHSYGVGVETYYGDEGAAYDLQVFNNPTMVHVFSSGNAGKSTPTESRYKGLTFANLTGNFKQAKNVLVVTAVDSTLTRNDLNSRGPAFDGRLKPELTAYGQGGTSEAAALTSGTVALIQQLYKQKFGTLPDAALVKAILIASADDLGPSGIDFSYGYGSVNAANALRLVELTQLNSVNITSNSEKIISITIPANTTLIKIAVSWIDPAIAPNQTAALANDIDSWLEVGAQQIRPWVLSSYPRPDSLLALPVRKIDRLNNTEYITLENPAAGNYNLHITAPTLVTGSQNVSVAYALKSTTLFEWDFPLAGDKLEAGKNNLITWQAQPNQIGDLYQQLGNGLWQLVKTNINLNTPTYYKTPHAFSKAKLKMVIGGIEYLSPEFVISPVMFPHVAFACADSLGLTWANLPGASEYRIYNLGLSLLSPIIATDNNTLVLPTTLPKYFSVAPIGNGTEGLRSQLIDYTQQGSSCFLNSFSAQRASDGQISVSFGLSSWFGIKQLELSKWNSQQSNPTWQIIQPNGLFGQTINDDQPTSGKITYQLKIVFTKGKSLLSPESSVFIEEKGKVVLFPNPVDSNTDLSILSEGTGTFKLYDLLGRNVLSLDLDERVQYIDVLNLPNGLYTYQLVEQTKVKDSGRLIKL
ncbi:MAG: S8 family peptidase [Bacteroidota bacterium]|jgi:hypothetical protein|nr:S8 family peptidase [Cytophagales bacterium]